MTSSHHHQLPGFFFQTYFRITLYTIIFSRQETSDGELFYGCLHGNFRDDTRRQVAGTIFLMFFVILFDFTN
jgi:hypothetical protein